MRIFTQAIACEGDRKRSRSCVQRLRNLSASPAISPMKIVENRSRSSPARVSSNGTSVRAKSPEN